MKPVVSSRALDGVRRGVAEDSKQQTSGGAREDSDKKAASLPLRRSLDVA
jgi:hypothetical protein